MTRIETCFVLIQWGAEMNRKATFVVFLCLLVLASVVQAAKQPVPTEADQQQAMNLAKEIYGEEYATAKKMDQKRALAEKLLKKAAESKDDPASCFVLLKIARDISVTSGELELALKAIEQMALTFEIDLSNMKQDVFLQTAKSVQTQAQHESVARAAFGLIDDAVAKDAFEVATAICQAALVAGKEVRQKELVAQLSTRLNQITMLASSYTSFKQAMAVLKDQPTDAAANLAAGDFLCFSKGEWDRGLPMVALGNDAIVAALAKQELQASTSPDQRVKVGDGWWSFAEQQDDDNKKQQIQKHAGSWYQQALPELKGLVKDKVERRLKDSGFVKSPLVANNDSPAGATGRDRHLTPSTKQPVAVKTKPPVSTKTNRPMTVKLNLTNQKALLEYVDLTVAKEGGGSWRIEPDGLRLQAVTSMISKKRFEGNFTLDLVYDVHRSDGFECKVEVLLWGVSIVASGRHSDGPKAVRVQRKGDQIICQRADGTTNVVMIKDEVKNNPSSFTVNVYRHWQYSGTMVALFKGIGYQGISADGGR